MTKRRTGIPTRDELDRIIDELLDQPWIGPMDRLRIDLVKDANAEYQTLRALVRLDPHKKTPAVADRLDALRKELNQAFADFGLSPAGRKDLGIPQGSVSLGAQNRNRASEDVVIGYHRPRDHEAFMKHLVKTGIWDAVGEDLKAQLAAEDNSND